MKTTKHAAAAASIVQAAKAYHASAGSPAVPQSTPELFQKLGSLQGNTTDLENIVDELEKRLDPLVKPLPGAQGDGTDCAATPPPMARLSNEVENIAGRLFYLRNRISALMDSLAI